MKNNHLHTRKTTKKSLVRARRVLFAICVIAAVTLAGVALAVGAKRSSGQSSKPQIVGENPGSEQNSLAEKYRTLVMRVYFHDRAERDQLAQ